MWAGFLLEQPLDVVTEYTLVDIYMRYHPIFVIKCQYPFIVMALLIGETISMFIVSCLRFHVS